MVALYSGALTLEFSGPDEPAGAYTAVNMKSNIRPEIRGHGPMKRAFIVLPNQLFKSLPGREFQLVILAEINRYFSDFNFHRKKLIFHRASMKYYAHRRKSRGYAVEYLDHAAVKKAGGLVGWLKKKKIGHVTLYDPVDVPFEQQFKKACSDIGIEVTFLENPAFLCSDAYLRDALAGKKHYSMNSFYIQQRKERGILLENGKPKGGKWSFDSENRKPLGKDVPVPKIHFGRLNKYAKEAVSYVDKHFQNNPGSSTNFFYPVTHRQAERWLDEFVENRLAGFGPYEDAIAEDERFLFHSLLSPLLNSGLLLPGQVLEAVLKNADSHNIPLNSVEGFVRQVVGWREFMRGVYLVHGQHLREENFWGFEKPLPRSFYDGSTGIKPVDAAVHAVLENAYAHHIERLMILGNFMLLCEIRPDDVYRWFMELFIDAYDWVMVPNVYGMSQYAHGGIMTSKPYISSSNYVCRMSQFSTGSWCQVWDALFWRFIAKHKTVFEANPRMKVMTSHLKRFDEKKLRSYKNLANTYLQSLFND